MEFLYILGKEGGLHLDPKNAQVALTTCFFEKWREPQARLLTRRTGAGESRIDLERTMYGPRGVGPTEVKRTMKARGKKISIN